MTSPRSFPNPLLRAGRFPPSVPRASWWYSLLRGMLWIIMPLFWKVRVFGRHHEPASGSVLYICNHQSILDPMLVGFGLQRPVNYMARDNLFRFPIKRLIESVYTFPVRRDRADLTAMKEAMRRLKAGGQLLVFAEGTRTHDGRIGPLLPGVNLLARRAADWIVPVVIDGAFEAWPRTQPLPGLGSVVVRFGKPISKQDACKSSNEEFLQSVRRTMIGIQTDIRRRLGRPALTYP